jgi:hypothetical protein
MNGKYSNIPFLTIPVSSSDKSVLYEAGKTRLDKLSQLYYNNPLIFGDNLRITIKVIKNEI